MTQQDATNYSRIAEAIEYIRQNFRRQPSLDEVAEKISLSPFHFQRVFSEWAGVSPKKFLQYLSVEYAKSLLKEKQSTLFDAALDTGLSGTGRLHDLFVKIEGMTPGEYRNGGEDLDIGYRYAETLFGDVLIASTGKGICHLAFIADESSALQGLKNNFPNARFRESGDEMQENALAILSSSRAGMKETKLHLRATDFQLKVWSALLKIPSGELTTYGTIARKVGDHNASRAVGSAVGDNPVAFLIPCHRVIRSSGIIGEYRWGSSRKCAMIGWEAAITAQSEEVKAV